MRCRLLCLNAVSVGTARETPEPCYRSDTKKPPSCESGFICAVKGGQGEDNLHSVSHGIPRGAGYLSNACPQIRFLKKIRLFDFFVDLAVGKASKERRTAQRVPKQDRQQKGDAVT